MNRSKTYSVKMELKENLDVCKISIEDSET